MNDERYQLGNFYRVSVDMVTNLHQRTILLVYPEPLPDGLTVVIDYVHTNSTTFRHFPCSTTTRSQVDLTTQADYCDKFQSVLGTTWTANLTLYTNCTILSFTVHSSSTCTAFTVILLLYYRLPSCTAHTFKFRSSVHLLTCTAHTVIQSANRASSVHSPVCTACTVLSRRSVHCSFVVEYNTYYVVYYDRPRQLRQLHRLPLWEKLRGEHPSAADVHLIIVPLPTWRLWTVATAPAYKRYER